MREKGKKLTYNDRIVIEFLFNKKTPKAQIARQLNLSRSKLYDELERGYYEHLNTDLTKILKYSAVRAQQRHDFNVSSKGRPLKIGNDYEFADFVTHMIKDLKYSPRAVVDFIEINGLSFNTEVCYATIYRYIKDGVLGGLKPKDLPYQDKRKKKKEPAPKKPVNPNKTSIEERPGEINSRELFGHWEMDSVVGKREKGETSLTFVERQTRMALVLRCPDKTAASAVGILDGLEQAVGAESFRRVFQSITCDNGVEFSDEKSLRRSSFGSDARTQIYYCHPYCSGERGSNEKNNQMIRRFIKKGTKIESYTDADLKFVQSWLNDYPRLIHGGKSARMMFEEQLKLLNIPMPKIFERY